MESLPVSETTVFARLRADVAVLAGRAAARSNTRYVLRYGLFSPGLHYVLGRRLQEALVKIPLVGGILRRFHWFVQALLFSTDISPTATIGGGFYLPHPFAIVIGDGAVIGRNVSIYQNVTIGQRNADNAAMARIEDNVYIGAGAVILGGVTVGAGAIIGANAVVLQDVPAGARAVGNPARIVSGAAGERTQAG
ncbi:MAG: serine O-acetyltransferase [Erythrobacter sp.]|uniref:serine O-acetyltransferase n=1 Tax=Qipengyuania flava TaxID=192812 RepID=UPI000C530D78|nr:DapH/DapD/GlmU-related protein [Qipengyuania flava]MAQ30842.1 serine O-acetyltransferase [Erythrobacter sp.]MCA0889541.1 serine acetyltransferase [Qipengyuania flava]|tara:strand:- start:9840 stop:10421 length:582 start_codon:yes stop_codon:yes gene_type:complete